MCMCTNVCACGRLYCLCSCVKSLVQNLKQKPLNKQNSEKIWGKIRLVWADGNTYEGGWKNDNISPGTKGLVQRYSCFFITCHNFDVISFATATACTYLGFLSDNLTRHSSCIFTHQLPLTWSFHILADFFYSIFMFHLYTLDFFFTVENRWDLRGRSENILLLSFWS